MSSFDWNVYESEVRKWISEEKNSLEGNKELFFRDGVVNEILWNSENNFKILFVLKEVYDAEGPYEEFPDNRSWKSLTDKNDMIDIFKEEMWRKVSTFTAGLEKALLTGVEIKPDEYSLFPEPNEIDTIESSSHLEYINKIAIMDLKKLGGGEKTSSPRSKKSIDYTPHCRKFHMKIREQILEINPKIIICCGPDVFANLNELVYPQNKNMKDSYINEEGIIIIKNYHPSYWRWPNSLREDFFAKPINKCLELWSKRNNE